MSDWFNRVHFSPFPLPDLTLSVRLLITNRESPPLLPENPRQTPRTHLISQKSTSSNSRSIGDFFSQPWPAGSILLNSIARSLRIERQTWEILLQPATAPLLQPPSSTIAPTSISPNVLDSAPQAAILTHLLTAHPKTPRDPPTANNVATIEPPSTLHQHLAVFANSRLQKATHNIEFEIDKFADNVHVLASHIEDASRLADQALSLSAAALEERDREGRERAGGGAVGVRDVLRGLSRVID